LKNNHHNHEKPASLKNLVFAILINGGIVIFEMIFGLLIQSMALISDAVHNLSDIAAMGFSYWAEKISRRPADARKTYGYRKFEFVAAFVNSIALSVVIAFVFWETLKRLMSPPEIAGQEMLLVAVVALLGNGAAALLLQKISGRNFNMKSAWLHSLQDALLSLGVIVGALLIAFFGCPIIDPLISMIICIFIAREIYKIIRYTINSLIDAVPPDIDYVEVRNDLHIWQTGTEQRLLSAHLKSDMDSPDNEMIINAVQKMLVEKYGINHTTIPILPLSAGEMNYCTHCNAWIKDRA